MRIEYDYNIRHVYVVFTWTQPQNRIHKRTLRDFIQGQSSKQTLRSIPKCSSLCPTSFEEYLCSFWSELTQLCLLLVKIHLTKEAIKTYFYISIFGATFCVVSPSRSSQRTVSARASYGSRYDPARTTPRAQIKQCDWLWTCQSTQTLPRNVRGKTSDTLLRKQSGKQLKCR